jgi:hypothetical protein
MTAQAAPPNKPPFNHVEMAVEGQAKVESHLPLKLETALLGFVLC